ncbi:MAG: hypothetical protein Q8R04_07075 [Nanoarchaeota archaeon]|nr:hypothetical protein [Nanoarchaeota archaeon]
MRKILTILFLLLFIASSCKPQEAPIKEPFCGDNVCQSSETENGCAADCGGFGGITNKQCSDAKGNWNDCGSPCAGTGSEFCIQMCQAQCECGGIAGFNCPKGFKCRLTGKIADEMGACIKE